MLESDVAVTATYKELPPATYALTVNGGTGDSNYAAVDDVTITANTAPLGQEFDRWVVNSGSPTIANISASSTILTMSASAATVTATYKNQENTIPVAEAGNYANLPYDSSVTLDGVGSSDADGDSLSYRWRYIEVPTDSNNIILNNMDTRTPTFITDAYGRYVIELIVNDGHEDSLPDTVEIKVGTVPDTGQIICINDALNSFPCPTDDNDPLYGQDGYYAINPPSFTKLGQGGFGSIELPDNATEWIMVRDNVIGLIWEAKTNNGSFHDRGNQYSWYDSNSSTNGGNAGVDGDGTDTEDFLKTLNDSRFGDFNDWRLPTLIELQSIVDYSHEYPAVDIKYFPDIDPYTLWPYWSSTSSFSSEPSSAMWIEFLFGFVGSPDIKSKGKHVRAVRGEQSIALFTDNGDGTITDRNTGLMWMKATADTNVDGNVDIDDMVTWKGALNYCKYLNLAGKSDWRLPNVKELISIVNYNQVSPTIDTTYFSETMSDNYWSSTSGANRYQDIWTVNFDNGKTETENRVHVSIPRTYVRAVRGGL